MKSCLLAFLLIATPVLADSPFDGTWVWDTDSTQLSTRPDVYLLDQGVYHCESCIPPLQVPADAKEHPVVGQSNYDALTVTVVDAAVVKVAMTKSGKLVNLHTLTVAQDGKQLIDQTEDHSTANPIVQRVQAERVTYGPPSSHLISGSWRQTKIESVSETGTTVTLKVTAEDISFKDPSGVGYEARFDGKDYPMTGVNSDTMVSVRLLDERTFEETAKHDGKVESVIRLTVAADGKTAEYVYDDRRQGTVTRGRLHKKLSAAGEAAAQERAPTPMPQSAPTAVLSARIGAGQTCAGKPENSACWKELDNRSGCFFWNPVLGKNETVTWVGECKDGIAQGQGTLTFVWDGDHRAVDEGMLIDGKQQGRWVLRVSNGDVEEGLYKDGKRAGRWVIHWADGSVGEGAMIGDDMDGEWVVRLTNGTVEKRHYVKGVRH